MTVGDGIDQPVLGADRGYAVSDVSTEAHSAVPAAPGEFEARKEADARRRGQLGGQLRWAGRGETVDLHARGIQRGEELYGHVRNAVVAAKARGQPGDPVRAGRAWAGRAWAGRACSRLSHQSSLTGGRRRPQVPCQRGTALRVLSHHHLG
jgi:hypothetical protein